MSIINNVTQQASVFMNNFVPTLSPLNKRIALAAVAAISILALCYYAFTTLISHRKYVELDNLDQQPVEEDKKAAEEKPLDETEAEKTQPENKERAIILYTGPYTGPKGVAFDVFNLGQLKVPAFIIGANQTNFSLEDKLARQYLQQAQKDAAEALKV